MKNHASALIVAGPDLLREGLRAALIAVHCFQTVDEADSAASALAMHVDHDPALVLFSTDEPVDQTLAGFRQIKARWPEAWCIVLVDTVAQQQSAQAAGLEEVLVKGVRPDKLLGTIEDLIRGDGQAAAR
jgi:DNA-binding NarL/FixJ family response regulator